MAAHDVKHEEARCHREKCAFVKGGDTIRDRGHGMLADTVMDVATRVIAIDTALGLQFRLLLSVFDG